jgi:chaperonin GroES
MSKIKPLHNRVLVKRIDTETKTAGGIIIPDSAQEKPTEGVIIAVSNKVKDVKIGDKVLFEKWGAIEIKVVNEEVLILEESKIIAVIQEKPL